jgi:hypothetical protein
MRRFALVICLALPLTAVGTLVAHAVAYRLLGAPSEGVHGYLAHLPQLLTVLALPLALALAIAGRARAPKAWPFAAASVAAFVAQEHLERLAHTGELPLLVDRPVFLLGLVLQVPFAVAAWLVARALISVAGSSPRRTVRRFSALLLPLSIFPTGVPRARVAVGLAAPRGPPAVLPAR